MANPSSVRFNLPYLKRQAKELHRAFQAGEAAAYARIKTHLLQLSDASATQLRRYVLSLREAQLAIAREQGFASWAKLKRHIESPSPVPAPRRARLSDEELARFIFPKEQKTLTPIEFGDSRPTSTSGVAPIQRSIFHLILKRFIAQPVQ